MQRYTEFCKRTGLKKHIERHQWGVRQGELAHECLYFLHVYIGEGFQKSFWCDILDFET